MPNTARKEEFYTAEEYYVVTSGSEQLTELIGGRIVALASPTIQHNRIAQNLLVEMKLFIRKNKGKCEAFTAPTDVKLNEENIIIPDVFVACNPENFSKQHYIGAPDFVAEVVSTNRSDDFYRKLVLYQENGVREYWIIDPKNEKVLVYFFEDNPFPEIYDFHTPIPVRIWENRFSATIAEMY